MGAKRSFATCPLKSLGIGALSTFALLTLPAMAALLATSSVRATFATAAALSIVLPCLALTLSFYLDLPAGPASVALLAVSVPLAAALSKVAGWGNTPPRWQAPPTGT
jgi:ABC-type Mn2+/Zn2+ transport system permease subunit